MLEQGTQKRVSKNDIITLEGMEEKQGIDNRRFL